MKLPFIILWVLGVVIICSFRTPVKYYLFYDRFVVVYTHIFSNRGKILMGQLVLYILIWSAFVFLSYLIMRAVKRSKQINSAN